MNSLECNSPIWTSDEAVKATGGKSNSSWVASGVSIDTRTLKKGDLFIALKGDNFDGHDYVSEAFEKGAAACIVNRGERKNLLVVDDTEKALWDLARFSRNRSNAKIIGITGSVGKTTVKELLASVLKNPHYTKGNLNNHIGLPLTLARLPKDCRFGIFELGMNHKGEISELTKLLKPHIAVITAIEPAHMEFFNSIDDIVDAKAEIFEGNHETAIVPSMYYRKFNNAITFGKDDYANYRFIKRDSNIEAIINGKSLSYQLGLSGEHNAINSLAVLAVVDACGENLENAANLLKNVKTCKGRGEIYALSLPPLAEMHLPPPPLAERSSPPPLAESTFSPPPLAESTFSPPPLAGHTCVGGVGGGVHTTRNKRALANAKKLRKNLTKAEAKLWNALKSNQLGYKFRKQQPIGNYITDFVCNQKGLIIELDGGQHAEQAKHDQMRTEFLEKAGYTVLRFWNNDVLENIYGICEVILARLGELPDVHLKRSSCRTPPPTPPASGGGGEWFTLIDDSYNASPSSMSAALSVLGECSGRKIAVLGDMLELGSKAPAYHADLYNDIIKNKIDLVFTAGELMFNLYKNLPSEIKGTHCKEASDLLFVLKENVMNNDVILIKGSHGTLMWKLAANVISLFNTTCR